MKLQLAPTGVFWALMHPSASLYVGGETNEGGYSRANSQDIQVVLTSEEPGPVELDHTDLPSWAMHQIMASKTSGLILVEGLPQVNLKPSSVLSPAPIESELPVKEQDFGILAQSVSSIKTKTGSMTLSELSDLLDRETNGLNPTGAPRSSLTTYLKGKIESLKE